MRNQSGKSDGSSGIALVIVLGLLAILTILAVAFASAMWVERMAAWNHANSVRAEALIQAALVRAMSDVHLRMVGRSYPCFTNAPGGKYDAMASSNGSNVRLTNLLAGEAMSNVSLALQADANFVATRNCYWIPIVADGRTNGRIAYVVVNSSGLMDINYAGGRHRNWSTNLAETDPGNLLQGLGLPAFTNQRLRDLRYETMTEAMALNAGVVMSPHEGFSTFSYDPARDQYFPMTNPTDIAAIMTIGRSEAVLSNKFDINAISKKNPDGSYRYRGYTSACDYTSYKTDPLFMAEYFNPLVAILSTRRASDPSKMMMERPLDVAWNIVNYIDPDRIPQGDDVDKPWSRSEGGEAIPLINEVVLKPYPYAAGAQRPTCGPASGAWSNIYEFAVELWYPFAPIQVAPSDGFSLWVGVFTNIPSPPDLLSITNPAYVATNYTFSSNILNMAYGGIDFLVCTSPINKKISFPVVVCLTNAAPFRYATNYLPIGRQTYVDGSNNSFTVDNGVWFLSRVYKTETNSYGVPTVNLPVDEGMGFDNTGGEAFDAANPDSNRKLKVFTNCVGYSVNDPRSNGQVKYWTWYGNGGTPLGGAGPYLWSNTFYATLGGTNVNCKPWSYSGSGLPIFATNGNMENIGELGYIWRSNLDSPSEEPRGTNFYWWRTINLMHFDEGAALLDWCTVRPTNLPARGLFSINSRQTNAFKAMFNNMQIGYVSGPETNFVMLDSSPGGDLDALVRTIITNGPYLNFRSMFTSESSDDGGGGPVAKAFRYAATNGHPGAVADIFCEDPFRRICELVTFRQNLFTIIMAAQVFGGDGQSVVGEKRAMATIYRDSYTGRYFIRSFKWLAD